MVVEEKESTLTLPADFEQALAANERARKVFSGLSTTRQKRCVDQIEAARTEATRRKRINALIANMALGTIQPIGG